MTIDSTAEDCRPGLRPPRFRLGSLMWTFVVLGVIFALINYLGSHATLLIILFVLVAAAHVAGNALGTQLRDNGDRPPGDVSETSRSRQRIRKTAPGDFAPVTRLRDRSSLGRPIVFITASGIVLGAAAGGCAMLLLIQSDLSLSTLASIGLGMLASGVLGGIWTFVAASFVQVACSALWQATRDAKTAPDERLESQRHSGLP